ncbi:MAG: hypothetical protein ABWX96_17600 [Propionibacteriaceae bacterium]
MSFCIRDSKCLVYDSVQKMPGYSIGNPICDSCRLEAMQLFKSLRLDYVDLSQLLPKTETRNDAGKIFRPKPESMPAMNMAPFTLRADLVYFVGVVARVLRRKLGLPTGYAGPVREGYQLDNDVNWLAFRMDELVKLGPVSAFFADTEMPEQLTGVEMIDRARSLHLKARRMCGTEPAVIKVPGFCPYCSAQGLRRNDDNAERLWCQSCHAKLSDIDYARVVLLQLHAARNPPA